MNELASIYGHILDNDICAARKAVEAYLNDHALFAVPAMPVEHCLALCKTLGEKGLARLIAGTVRAVACNPEADLWHWLLYYWGLRGSLGFLVTLELIEQLETRVTGESCRQAPLRDLLLRPSEAAGTAQRFVSPRERRVLQLLAAREVRFDPGDIAVYRFAFTSLRASAYACGYWQRTAREHLERAHADLATVWPELVKRPMLSSLLLRQAAAGHAQLRQWEQCESLIARCEALPGSQDDLLAWKVYLADSRGMKHEGRRLLVETEPQAKDWAQYWKLRTDVAVQGEDFAEARACMERNIALLGRKPHLFFSSLGYLNYREGRYEEAIRLWDRCGKQPLTDLADRLRQRIDAGAIEPRSSLEVVATLQRPNHCGPCALAMIARHWGIDVSQDEVAAESSLWGTHLYELAELAQRHGLTAIIASRDFDAVVDTVRAGFPVLMSFSYPGGGHFVIAVGYDPNLDYLELRDPGSTFKCQISRTAYHKESGYHDFLTAVICPADRASAVPAHGHPGSLDRDLCRSQSLGGSPQALCEALRSQHSEERLAETNIYADLRLMELLDTHRLAAARGLAKELLSRNGDSLYACSRVAETFLRSDFVQDAFEAVSRVDSRNGLGGDRRALDDLLNENHGASHEYLEFIRARCAMQLGNLQVAAASLLRSINQYPVQGHKFLVLAELMGRLGEQGEQLKFLDVAQQISGPSARAAMAELAILREKQDYAAASDLMDKALAQFPKQAWLWREKGRLCEELRLYDEAAAAYRCLCERSPDWHAGYTHLLKLYHRVRDVASAQTLLDGLDAQMHESPDRWCIRAYWASLQRDWATVLECVAPCLQAAPSHTWARYFQAEALEETGRLREAAAVWQRVVEEADPSDYYWDMAVAALGRLGRKLEDVAAFETAFRHAIEVAPDSPTLWSAMADCFRFRGRGQDATEYFDALYSRVTDKPGLALNVGQLMLTLRLPEEARRWFQRVPPHHARHAQAIDGIVNSLREENRFDEALALLRQTAENSPAAEIYSTLVDTCLDAYDNAEACRWLRRSLHEFPGILPGEAYRVARVLAQTAAVSELQSLVEFAESLRGAAAPGPRLQLTVFAAYARRYMKQYREALALCDEALAADAASGMAWIVKAEAHYEAREFEAAIDAARRSCETRYSVYPFRCLFGYLRNMGRIDEAFDACINALAIFPRDLSFQELLDDIVLEFRLLDRYLEACRRLFPLIEDKASFLGNQATVFWRMGELAQARQLYEQALGYGDYSWLHAQLGVIMRSEGDFSGAERELQTAIAHDAHYTYAAERLAALYADWYFSYERLAARFADDSAHPKGDLLVRIHKFYERMAETQANNHVIFRNYCQFCMRCGDLAPVRRLASRYAENSSVYAYVCCHLAEACEKLHDVEAQREWLRQAVERDEPEAYKAEAYRLMGDCVEKYDGDPNQALNWYRRAAAAAPDDADSHLAVARILEEQGRFAELLHELPTALQSTEDPLPLLGALARTAVQAEAWDEVRRDVEESLNRLPAKVAAEGWMKVSLGLAESYNYAAAEEALARAEATCPLPLDLEYTRLSIAKRRCDHETAGVVTQRLLRLDPQNRRALYESSRLALRRGDLVAALDLLERYIKAGGNLWTFLTQHAYAAVDLGLVPELLRFCEACYAESSAREYIHLLEIQTHHLCNDMAAVGRLMRQLEEIDASRVADAEILLADQLANRGDYEAVLPHLARAIERDRHNAFARSLFVGTKFALDDPDGCLEHLHVILNNPARDFWAMVALCHTPRGVYPDVDAEADRFDRYLQTMRRAAKEVRNRCTARWHLLEAACRWGLYSRALEYVCEALNEGPTPSSIVVMFEAATELGDLDLAERVIAVGQSLHVHPTTIAQMKSSWYALRGDADRAIAFAYDSRHGHGGMFADMCQRLIELEVPLGGLSDVLFDCMTRYHEGHGACCTWALLLLFNQRHFAQFEHGLARMAAGVGDYCLNLEQRRSLAAAVTAAQLHRAQQSADTEGIRDLRQRIAAMPFFGSDIGLSLYRYLGFARRNS